MTEQNKKDNPPSEIEDNNTDEGTPLIKERQDQFVVFTLDKDVRSAETVKLKVSEYTGVVVKMKIFQQFAMENLLQGLTLDNRALSEQEPVPEGQLSLIHLRFEETHITHKTAGDLADFLRQKHFLESIGFNKVRFEGSGDFRKILDAIRTNKKITKLIL